MDKVSRNNKLEVLLWSIALPGFGQFLNKKYVKGIVLIILEVMINIKGKVNTVIMLSFLGETLSAINEANYLWLMFYPCIYLFAIWDAYRDVTTGEDSYLFIPFVFSAYVGTLGVIFSSKVKIFNVYIGPVFLPLISMICGFVIGLIIKKGLSLIK